MAKRTIKDEIMHVAAPFNLNRWIAEHRHLLQPPVNNKNIYVQSEDYIVMIVGGPNARKDYHWNETEELFYQIEGTIEIDIQVQGKKETMVLHPGDIFLLPAKVPHSPRRPAGSVGLVVESKVKRQGVQDGLMWYCDTCNEKLYEVFFELEDIEVDFLKHFKFFFGSETLRICSKCGSTMETDPRFVKE